MTILKCKMCGGTLEVNDNSGIAVCEYCGTRQTVSKTDDDVLSNLYNRANNLRMKNEFDKALSVYEKIIETNDEETLKRKELLSEYAKTIDWYLNGTFFIPKQRWSKNRKMIFYKTDQIVLERIVRLQFWQYQST